MYYSKRKGYELKKNVQLWISVRQNLMQSKIFTSGVKEMHAKKKKNQYFMYFLELQNRLS